MTAWLISTVISSIINMQHIDTATCIQSSQATASERGLLVDPGNRFVIGNKSLQAMAAFVSLLFILMCKLHCFIIGCCFAI